MIGPTALRRRLLIVAGALELPTGGTPRTLAAARTVLVSRLGEPSARVSYLLLAVVVGRIPSAEEIVGLERDWRLYGAARAIDLVCSRARAAARWRLGRTPTVVVERGTVIDVHDTANTTFTTGIQRVARSVLPLWLARSSVRLVGWTAGFDAPRSLGPAETALALGRTPGRSTRRQAAEIVVPYECTWVLPEIAVDVRRAARTHAIARYSGSRAVAIGYDCIPITSAETAGAGMPGGFANYLAALAEFAVIAPISGASGTEFDGWRGMLGGAGLAGPTIRTIPLATASDTGDGSADGPLLERVGVAPDSTVVLAVGSHEPRKNHLALLQAAELVWRRGEDFSLVLVGGNSWDTEDFDAALGAALARGRSIIRISRASDATVWALYRRARFTVFPSLNEGFGLPVVESIAAGTPVITSDFGSMRESADGFGGVLVDPRDDAELARSMAKLLADDRLIERLRKQTASAPKRTWERYADDLWEAFALDASGPETT